MTATEVLQPQPDTFSLRPREVPAPRQCQCLINGVLYNITIRHKTTGENVALLPGNQAMINRLAQGVFSQLMDTSQKAGVRNFNTRDVQKITVDLSDMHQPDAVTYESAKGKKGETLDTAQTFSLDARIVQTALPELSKVSNVAVSLRRACTESVGSHASVSSGASEDPEERDGVSRTVTHLMRGEELEHRDVFKVSLSCISSKSSMITIEQFNTGNLYSRAAKATDIDERRKILSNNEPAVVYLLHAHHYSVIYIDVRNKKLEFYNPKGAPPTKQQLTKLAQMYENLFERKPGSGDIWSTMLTRPQGKQV